MADTKNALETFDKIKEAIKSLPGFSGDADKAALLLVGHSGDKPTAEADIKQLEKKAEALFKTHEKTLTGYNNQLELSQLELSETLKAGGDTKALNAANKTIADRAADLKIDPKNIDGEAANRDLYQLLESKKGKDDDAIGAYLQTLEQQHGNLQQGSRVLKAATSIIDPANIKEAAEAKKDVIAALNGKDFHSLDKHFEEFDKHFDGLADVKAKLKSLTASVKATKDPEKLKKAEGALAEFEAHIADVKKHYRDAHTGTLAGIANVDVLADHAAAQAEAASKIILENGSKGYNSSHGLDAALKSIENPSKGAVFERTAENAKTVAKNLGSKFEAVSKEIAVAGKGIGKWGVAGIIGGTVLAAGLVGKTFGSETVRDEQGNAVTNEQGEEQKKTNALKFALGAAVTVGAIWGADKFLNKGKGFEATKEVVGKWTGKILGEGKSKGFGLGV